MTILRTDLHRKKLINDAENAVINLQLAVHSQEFSSSELPIINTPIKQQLVLKAELTKEDEIEAAAILDLLI